MRRFIVGIGSSEVAVRMNVEAVRFSVMDGMLIFHKRIADEVKSVGSTVIARDKWIYVLDNGEVENKDDATQ